MKKKYLIQILAITIIIFNVSCRQNVNLLGDDIRLFDEIKPLAKAVSGQRIVDIRELISKHPEWINYHEPKYGKTLLHWVVLNNKSFSLRALLETGADSNLPDNNGASPLIAAAAQEYGLENVLILLDYGAEINYVARPKDPERLAYSATPLIASVESLNIKIMKTLVDKGADINYCYKPMGVMIGTTALSLAFNLGQVDMIYFLLVENGAKFDRCISKTINGRIITIKDSLYGLMFERGTSDYKTAQKIFSYLKQHGVDVENCTNPKGEKVWNKLH